MAPVPFGGPRCVASASQGPHRPAALRVLVLLSGLARSSTAVVPGVAATTPASGGATPGGSSGVEGDFRATGSDDDAPIATLGGSSSGRQESCARDRLDSDDADLDAWNQQNGARIDAILQLANTNELLSRTIAELHSAKGEANSAKCEANQLRAALAAQLALQTQVMGMGIGAVAGTSHCGTTDVHQQQVQVGPPCLAPFFAWATTEAVPQLSLGAPFDAQREQHDARSQTELVEWVHSFVAEAGRELEEARQNAEACVSGEREERLQEREGFRAEKEALLREIAEAKRAGEERKQAILAPEWEEKRALKGEVKGLQKKIQALENRVKERDAQRKSAGKMSEPPVADTEVEAVGESEVGESKDAEHYKTVLRIAKSAVLRCQQKSWANQQSISGASRDIAALMGGCAEEMARYERALGDALAEALEQAASGATQEATVSGTEMELADALTALRLGDDDSAMTPATGCMTTTQASSASPRSTHSNGARRSSTISEASSWSDLPPVAAPCRSPCAGADSPTVACLGASETTPASSASGERVDVAGHLRLPDTCSWRLPGKNAGESDGAQSASVKKGPPKSQLQQAPEQLPLLSKTKGRSAAGNKAKASAAKTAATLVQPEVVENKEFLGTESCTDELLKRAEEVRAELQKRAEEVQCLSSAASSTATAPKKGLVQNRAPQTETRDADQDILDQALQAAEAEREAQKGESWDRYARRVAARCVSSLQRSARSAPTLLALFCAEVNHDFRSACAALKSPREMIVPWNALTKARAVRFNNICFILCLGVCYTDSNFAEMGSLTFPFGIGSAPWANILSVYSFTFINMFFLFEAQRAGMPVISFLTWFMAGATIYLNHDETLAVVKELANSVVHEHQLAMELKNEAYDSTDGGALSRLELVMRPAQVDEHIQHQHQTLRPPSGVTMFSLLVLSGLCCYMPAPAVAPAAESDRSQAGDAAEQREGSGAQDEHATAGDHLQLASGIEKPPSPAASAVVSPSGGSGNRNGRRSGAARNKRK